jgi:hypothetical protein
VRAINLNCISIPQNAEVRTMHSPDNARGYLLVYRDWYELPDEPDPLRRNAIVSTLNPAFQPSAGAQLVKRAFEVLEPVDVIPFAFTICECRPAAEHPFDTIEDAQDYLREHGVRHPHIGFNPIG